MQIRTLNGGDFRLEFLTGTDADTENLALAAALGFGNIADTTPDGAGSNNVEFSALADVALRSLALYDNSGTQPEIAQASTLLSNIEDEDTNALFAGIGATADTYSISINGDTYQAISLVDATSTQAITVQSFVDQINDNDSLNTFIEAAYDDTTGQVTISAISAEVESISIQAADTVTANFGFGVTDNPNASGLIGAGGGDAETIRLASAAAELAQLEVDFDRVRDQITELVTNGDTGYRGTNLLNGNDLLTTFNEFRTSSLTTSGVTFTADGLGISEANFSRIDATENSLSEIRSALEAVRSFGSTLANDLTVIQTRETFTQNTINTLTAGADKLTIADQNEEGAKLLALQTRQQLGVTSLSLASQSQQSILRLF